MNKSILLLLTPILFDLIIRKRIMNSIIQIDKVRIITVWTIIRVIIYITINIIPKTTTISEVSLDHRSLILNKTIYRSILIVFNIHKELTPNRIKDKEDRIETNLPNVVLLDNNQINKRMRLMDNSKAVV